MLPLKVFSRLMFFSNGTSKRYLQQRVGKIMKERGPPTEFLWKAIENKSIKVPQDWKMVRNEILNLNGPITVANIDAMTVKVCTNMKKYDMALSYLDFLKEDNIKINLATLGNYFKLLYLQGIENSAKNEEKILSLYDFVRKTFPVLDSITLDSVIQALSITKDWKITVNLLDDVKVTATPSSYAYSAVISAAFLNNNDDLAWKLMDEVIDNNKVIQDCVYESYFQKISKSPRKLKELQKMFEFIQKNSIKLESGSMDGIIEPLKNLNLKVGTSTIYAKGICKCCGKRLKLIDLTNEEFTNLKASVLKNVIVGKDIFTKTTVEELTTFSNFIATIQKFDVIIDGLNVAYSVGSKQSPQVTSGLVAAVVSHFANQGKKVLVCGRKHMSRWPSKNWNYIQANSTVFLTENLSQDDPYLLYCALHSGKDTIIVTRDLMRGHKFLLKDPQLKILFDRWLTQRQWLLFRVQDRGSSTFKKPLPYTEVAQEVESYWHLPFVPKNSTKINWLCIKLM